MIIARDFTKAYIRLSLQVDYFGYLDKFKPIFFPVSSVSTSDTVPYVKATV